MPDPDPKAESIVPPVGSTVRIYCNGVYHKGRVLSVGPKRVTVEYRQSNGIMKQVKAFVYPEGTLLSATNWGVGGRTAFYRVPALEGESVSVAAPFSGQMEFFD